MLLDRAGIAYRLVAPGPEPEGEGEAIERARQRARSKALGAHPPAGDGLVLGADTVVEWRGRELGKPAGAEAARAMLRALSGETHRVHSAVCLALPGGRILEDVASASVRVAVLDDAQIDAYVATGSWRGKAGGYGIQEAECGFAHLVAGGMDTVVGLPVDLVRALLRRAEGVT